MSTLERTLGLIKPDAVRAGKSREIMQLAELSGFQLLAKKTLQLSQERAEEFYAEHQGKPFFPGLVGFMTSGPLYAMVLGREDAVKSWRGLMGPTNSLTAREQQPTCLRALYGTNGTQNATHGSDSSASANREIAFFFPELQPDALEGPEATATYLQENLNPTLLKGLTELAREKPSSNPREVLRSLAFWLLENNPNKPHVMEPEGDASQPMVEEPDDD
ncbi:hypothetical protein WJX84_005017 [Apatococcus fuscideae]|uniref:Nucleoside diphosphate kinase-like domain-containing protein n=1 Tax=Apatococcus fuscideae TaxID=2026836 RepID=A0AAW1STX8_9CHLO